MDREHVIRRRIALVAHDNKKQDLLGWAQYNATDPREARSLRNGNDRPAGAGAIGPPRHPIQERASRRRSAARRVDREGEIDLVLFFWDPLEPQPHDPDVRVLLRIAVVWNIPIVCNRATADYLISSPLLSSGYQRDVPRVRPRRAR